MIITTVGVTKKQYILYCENVHRRVLFYAFVFDDYTNFHLCKKLKLNYVLYWDSIVIANMYNQHNISISI